MTRKSDLGFGIWDLGFGIWDLGFGIWEKMLEEFGLGWGFEAVVGDGEVVGIELDAGEVGEFHGLCGDGGGSDAEERI